MAIKQELQTNGVSATTSADQGALSAVLHRSLHEQPLKVVSAEGLYLTLDNGQRVLDATGGAAVACLGHNNAEVKTAILNQLDSVAYCHSLFYSTDAAEKLCKHLIDGTNGHMRRAFIVSSGSEAIEAAMKMARQYFVELEGRTTERKRFIARKQSYHGTTMGALGLGGHIGRRQIYEPLLSAEVSHVSACHAYRGQRDGESDSTFVARLAQELDDEFQRLGPTTVCAFVAEPIVGVASGCVPAVKGYFRAIKEVCDKYGALLILDEIMSGMGRSGYLHAWQSPVIDAVPDLQTIGKGLGGGYAPVAAMLLSGKVVDVLSRGTGSFAHGQTYQGHPVSCAAACSVLEILKRDGLVEQARQSGLRLEQELKSRLSELWCIGDIRGMGLFWAIEFVKDQASKEPFDPQLQVGMGVHQLGMQEPYSISLYPGSGIADGLRGDCVLLAPPYTCTEDEIVLIVDKTVSAITAYFDQHHHLRPKSISKVAIV